MQAPFQLFRVKAEPIPVDGGILIAGRPRHKRAWLNRGSPRGKVGPGIRLADRHVRKIREEPGREISIGPLFRKIRSHFDDFFIDRVVLWCKLGRGEPYLEERAGHRTRLEGLRGLPFTPVDGERALSLRAFENLPVEPDRTHDDRCRRHQGSQTSP